MLRKITLIAAFAALVPIGFMPPQASACPPKVAVAANANIALNANAVVGQPVALGVPVVPLAIGCNALSPRAQRINDRQSRRQSRRCGTVAGGVTASAVVLAGSAPQPAPAQPNFELVPNQSNATVTTESVVTINGQQYRLVPDSQEAPAPADATVQEKAVAANDVPTAEPMPEQPAPVPAPAPNPVLVPVPSRVSFDVPVYTPTYQTQTYSLRMVADAVAPYTSTVLSYTTPLYTSYVMPTYRYLAYTALPATVIPAATGGGGFFRQRTVTRTRGAL